MNQKHKGAKPAPTPSTALAAHSVVGVEAGVLKDACLQLLDRVRDQDLHVIVTKDGEPVAKVVRPDGHMPSAFGFMRGTVLAHENIISPDFEVWGDGS